MSLETSGLWGPVSGVDNVGNEMEAGTVRSLAVVAGGIVGTLARWSVGEIVTSSSSGFPWATLVVNVTGAFALGAVGVVLIERVTYLGHLRTFLAIGLLGSYTTFSAMAVEGVRLIDTHHPGLAAGYWVATLVLGQVAGVLGMWSGRLRVPVWKETG
jgi:CrcB protein